jgi:uncharacterized membrane protein YfcA
VDAGLINFGLLAVALLALGIGSLAKGITGVGLPILGVPLLASFTSVEEAVVLMVLPGIAANTLLVITHRKWQLLRQHTGFLLAGFAGGLLGTWLLSQLDDRWLKLVLAAWLGVYLVQFVSGRAHERYFSGRGGLGPALGLAAGTIQGACGISAPIVAPYFHANGLVREAYAFATGFAFLLFSGAQIAAMTEMDLLTPDRLTIGLLVVAPTLLFTHWGIRLARRISDKVFHRILLVLFVAMEVKLVVDVLRPSLP